VNIKIARVCAVVALLAAAAVPCVPADSDRGRESDYAWRNEKRSYATKKKDLSFPL